MRAKRLLRELRLAADALSMAVGAMRRDVVVSADNFIAFSQFDPLSWHIPNSVNVSYREASYVHWQRLKASKNVDRVWMQCRWDTDDAVIGGLIQGMRDRFPAAALIFCDWWAPTHFPKPLILDKVDAYVKKNLLIDTALYATGFHDTNLVEYEAEHFGTHLPPKQPGISFEKLRPKLIQGWNLAASNLMLKLLQAGQQHSSDRPTDVHFRSSATKHDSWYGHMRRRALAAALQLNSFKLHASTEAITHDRYIEELSVSKICVSPFGYGEVCWRDFEAIACGAVLVKPDMSHLSTKPNVYIPYETYMPVKWDYSDLDEHVHTLLNDEPLRNHLTSNARSAWLNYIVNDLPGDRAKLLAVKKF